MLPWEKALQEAKKSFQRSFYSNPAAMTLSDEEGRYIDVNESFSKLTGYNREELVGHTSAELNIINNEKPEQYLDELKGKDLIQSIESKILTKSGEKCIILLKVEPIELDDKINYISFIYDITERKKLEEELRKSRDNLELKVQERTAELDILIDELKRSNEELQQFAYVSSS